MTFSQEFVISSCFSRFSPGCFVGFTQQRYALSHGVPENCLQTAEKCPCNRWKIYLRSAILYFITNTGPNPQRSYPEVFEMSNDELLFFTSMPQMLPLYTALRDQLDQLHPDVTAKVGKTQISLRNRYVFATVSLPWRKVKGWPEEYLLLSFGLSYRKEHPRIALAVEPYPNRWTHHVLLTCLDDLDETVMGWVEEAYQFSMEK